MMKILTRSGILLLAVLLLAGSTGFTITRFYCGPHLQSIHVLTEPTPCCAQSNEPGGFCRTEKEYVKADIKSELPVKKQGLPPLSFVQPLFCSNSGSSLSARGFSPPSFIENTSHSPPLIYRHLPVYTQSFLF